MKISSSLLLLFALISCSSNDRFNCAYIPAVSPENPYPELTPSNVCGELLDPDTLIANKELLAKLHFGGDDLAEIRFQGSVFYVSRTGNTARMFYYDNGADYFEEGLARSIKNGKVGFVDKQLNTVITPAYDFATPFNNGISEVCNDCSKQYHGEHWEMVGGAWGKIDAQGNLVSPLQP